MIGKVRQICVGVGEWQRDLNPRTCQHLQRPEERRQIKKKNNKNLENTIANTSIGDVYRIIQGRSVKKQLTAFGRDCGECIRSIATTDVQETNIIQF